MIERHLLIAFQQLKSLAFDPSFLAKDVHEHGRQRPAFKVRDSNPYIEMTGTLILEVKQNIVLLCYWLDTIVSR